MSFIQQFFTSRDNNANAETFVGQVGRLWWDPVTNKIYYSDGSTPGGIAVSGGGGNGSPGGSNSQVQFNDSGSFGGVSTLTFDKNTGQLTTVSLSATGNVTADYFYGNGSQLTGVVATNIGVLPSLSVTGNVTAANYFGNGSQLTGIVASNVGTLPSLSVTGNVTAANYFGNGSQLTGIVATDVGILPSLSVTGNVTAGNYIGNGSSLTSTMTDRGVDQPNWDNLTQMGVYTVNRTSWAGTTGTPLDSQVFVGLLEVKNSTGTAIEQVFYPGTVEPNDVKIQWNRANWLGLWTAWIKIVNDDQFVLGGSY
jgi:hypothetical protein